MAEIETGKFKDTVSAIGADTLKAIATAGPEMQVHVASYFKLYVFILQLFPNLYILKYAIFSQVKLLKSLGLQSTLITDGSSPINLFNTAQGLVGGGLVPFRPSTNVDDDESC